MNVMANNIPTPKERYYFITNEDKVLPIAQLLVNQGIMNKKDLAGVLAQIKAETGDFSSKEEDLNYSPKRLLEVFPRYFKNLQDAKNVANQGPKAIADRVYGGRMGNAPDEGYKYRGRGLIQLTGKDNYKTYGDMIGVDLVNNPDLALNNDIAARIAAVYMKTNSTDLSDPVANTKAVGPTDINKKQKERAIIQRQMESSIDELFNKIKLPTPRERPADTPPPMPRERPADLQPEQKQPEFYGMAPPVNFESRQRQEEFYGRDLPPNLQDEPKIESEEDRQSFIDRIKQLLGTLSPSELKTVYNKGGLSMEKQMSLFNEGGLEQDGGMTDPVSGNDVPVGSTQAEVRDDIPAMLSEGEFVFPADVVRYIGLEKLMKIRQQAKEGLKKMDDMGQMGNSEEAIVPDDIPMESIPDIPFNIDDLDLMEEPQEFSDGGTPRRRYSFSELVGSTSQASAPKMRYFVNANGNILVIPEVNGKLMQEVPTGYSEKTQEQVLNPESNVSPQDKATVQKIEENMTTGDGFMSNADIAEMEAADKEAMATGTVSGLENTSLKDGKLDYDFNPMRDTPLALSAMPGFTGSVLGAFGSYANQFSAQSAMHEAAFGVTPSIGDILSGKTQAALEALSPTAFNAAKNKALQTYNKVIAQGGAADPASGGYGVDTTGVSGYTDPTTGVTSAFGPAGSFKDLMEKDLDKAIEVAKNQDIFSKAIHDLEKDLPGGSVPETSDVAAVQASDPLGPGYGFDEDAPDSDPEQGNEPGNVDTEGGVAEGIFNRGGIATKKKKVKYMKKGGLASRK